MENQKKKNSTQELARSRKPIRRHWSLRFFLALFLWGVIGGGLLIGWYAIGLPNLSDLQYAGQRKAAVQILAHDGTLLARYGGVHGQPTLIENLPPELANAVLATEDRRFFDHFGVDFIGVLRAIIRNVSAGSIRQGGSTITQQLAKNLFLTHERTIGRKIRETLLAFWLEYRFTKEQILTIYLNRVYLGAGVYGVDAAAQAYFGKPATRLTLYEAAVIAGLLKAPTRYNPAKYPKRAAKRANQVLRNMVAAGWLSEDKAKRYFRKRVSIFRRPATRLNTRYFSDWVLSQAKGLIGSVGEDLVIRTTLDATLQRQAERKVKQVLALAKRRNVSEAAFLAMKPNGAIRAMVGGATFAKSQFNRATQAQRQPGSAFKLFVYLAGLESGLKPEDRVYDQPVNVQGWSPRNYNRKHRGAMTLREGAARSSNAVAVAVAERVGRQKVLQAARRLGVTSKLGTDPSLALGVYEMKLIELIAAYAVIANDGLGAWPFGILEIRDTAEKILYRRQQGQSPRVVAQRHVALLNDILHASMAWGTGRAALLTHPAAGKTGTSQGNRDAWFVGYTRHLVAGVWMGNDDASPMKGVTGGGLPARLWKRIMTRAHRNLPLRPLPGVVSKLSDSR